MPHDLIDRLEKAAGALVDKLDECDPHIKNVCVAAEIHGLGYKGPSYFNELKELRAALRARAAEGEG